MLSMGMRGKRQASLGTVYLETQTSDIKMTRYDFEDRKKP